MVLHRSVEDIANVLREVTAAGAWYDDQLVGFARAVSDGRFHAYIDDVVVHPDYRRRGVASIIMDELLNVLADIETVSLFCAPEHVRLYERHGFTVHPGQQVLNRHVSG